MSEKLYPPGAYKRNQFVQEFVVRCLSTNVERSVKPQTSILPLLRQRYAPANKMKSSYASSIETRPFYFNVAFAASDPHRKKWYSNNNHTSV